MTTALPDDVEPADQRSGLRPRRRRAPARSSATSRTCRRRSATRSSPWISWGCPMVRREGCSTCPRRRSPAACIAPGRRSPRGWIRPAPESVGTETEPELEPLPDEDALAARGRLLVAEAVAATQAPLALRERLEGQRTTAASPRRRLAIFGLAAAALAAVVLVAVLAAGGSSGPSSGGPGVLAVAQVADAPRPAPRRGRPATASSTRASTRCASPTGASCRGPRAASGATSSAAAGCARSPTRRPTARPWATRSWAAPRAGPGAARERTVGGTTYAVLEADGDRVVTWRQGGRTCAARAVHRPRGPPARTRLVGAARLARGERSR